MWAWESELTDEERSALEVWREANSLQSQGYTAGIPALLLAWATGRIEQRLEH